MIMLNILKERNFYSSPPYADFPRSEYDERLRRIRGYMEEEKVDVLLLWDKSNIRYFSGFHSIHWSAMICPGETSGVSSG